MVSTLHSHYFSITTHRREEEERRRVQEIEQKAEQQPEKVRLAWDLARIKLEAYFDRNLSQINLIFWISVSVMIVGFGFILFSIVQVGGDADASETSYLGAIAGIITEFIGATFMFIYRSTLKQASAFMNTLDRINLVGMAVQILETIPEDKAELKSATKAEIAKLLLQSGKGEPGSREDAA